MSEVFILKLVTGETILTKLEEDPQMFHLVKPIAIFEQHDQASGKVGIAMADFMPYAEGHGVMKSAVVVLGLAQEALANNYREAIGDIILPPSKIQLAS